MIPIALVIAGLYSYQEEQTIDFESLTSAGLFGVFGAVGSGKSSILEAITFALYGQIERLNSKDNRNYNMMNLRSNKSYIKFTFLNAEHKKYKIERSFRRNSKRYDDVKPLDQVLYQWAENKWVPLPSTDVTPILGLSYENFKRTIIIPQGQFKEFIELGAKDRTQMMKEIFQLERFDLQRKTASLYSESKEALDMLTGSLSNYDTVGEEAINHAKATLESLEKELYELKNGFAIKETQFNQLCTLKADIDTKDQLKVDLEALLQHNDEYEERSKRLMRFETIHRVFALKVQNKNRIANELAEKKLVQVKAIQELTLIKEKFETLSNQLAALKPEHDSLPQKRALEQDLESVLRILSLEEEKAKAKTKLTIAPDFIASKEKAMAELKENLATINENLAQQKNRLPNPIALLEVEQWYGAFESICAQEKSISARKMPLLEQQMRIQQELGVGNNVVELLAANDGQIKDLEKKFDKLQEERAQLAVQLKLQHYANAIEEGKPCPLCGALEHPTVLAIDQVDAAILACDSNIEAVKTAQSTLQAQRNNLNASAQELQFVSTQISTIAAEEQEQSIKKQQQLKAFVWQQFDAKDKSKFLAVKADFEQMNAQIKQLEATQKASLETLEKEAELLQKANQRLEELNNELIKLDAQIQQNKQLIKQVSLSDWLPSSVEAVRAHYDKIKAAHDTLALQYQNYSEQYIDISPKLSAQSTKVDGLSDIVQTLEQQCAIELESLQALMEQHQLGSEEALHTILNSGLDTAKERAKIEAYTVALKSKQSSIATLEQKLAGKDFDQAVFERLQVEVELLKSKITQQSNQVAVCQSNLERLHTAFKEKEQLLQRHEQLQKRVDNLTTLKRLFDRSGFVEYASTSLLRQLCDQANTRFHRLTRNQLSLQMNENNDFEIIDYLNEGKARSVKTLSGGQSFQVSLSLALALAESVQSNAKAAKNFFFIDEGFGTQDAASVNIVFETLMQLQKENRIVGIISHVEELKSMMPLALHVVKDPERGSQIFETWKN